MAILALDSLEIGMTLKSNVCDRSGRLLLPAGVELSDKHLKVFRTWGISEADIVADDNQDSDNESEPNPVSCDPAMISALQKEVEKLFVRNDLQHPLIHELIQICVSRKITHAN